jgi:2-polyprenyl-6-hydroxyphenyl methylase / 3-demethylubiquinone-9 3-methyltransferase
VTGIHFALYAGRGPPYSHDVSERRAAKFLNDPHQVPLNTDPANCRTTFTNPYSFAPDRAIRASTETKGAAVGASETTVDSAEIARFAAQAEAWWDPQGSFWPLHRLNPVRLDFVRSRLLDHFRRDQAELRPFAGLRLLDIGCGGGLVAEPMARLGFAVTGIDAAGEAIAAASAHARAARLRIDYRSASVERLVEAGERFDAVLALEVIEHVANAEAFLGLLAALVETGGAVIATTINRTVRSFALAVVAAEYILGWLPRGTHDWRKFVRPAELILGLRRNGLEPTELAGLSYDPSGGNWGVSRDLTLNYIVAARRRSAVPKLIHPVSAAKGFGQT